MPMAYTLMGIIKELALIQAQKSCIQVLLFIGVMNEKDYSIYLWIFFRPWLMGINLDGLINSQLIIEVPKLIPNFWG